ncbi:MAG: hypothetical protein JJ886_14555 [Thalassospira sp.]|nr:hypothetical protein [Thalassospira sp.]MBO6804186.1 hypothetical protein [Thalassospira sp.]MBO6819647.1 hypothetical protein [Thalassospira sp.]
MIEQIPCWIAGKSLFISFAVMAEKPLESVETEKISDESRQICGFEYQNSFAIENDYHCC